VKYCLIESTSSFIALVCDKKSAKLRFNEYVFF
jgi:hypothetical protein